MLVKGATDVGWLALLSSVVNIFSLAMISYPMKRIQKMNRTQNRICFSIKTSNYFLNDVHIFEKIQEQALRILYDDYISTYDELLKKAGTNTLLINRLHLMTLTVFKSLN